MTQIIPNTQAVPQVIGSSAVVVNGTDHNWIPSQIMHGVKVLHVGDYSFSAEETGGTTTELKITLQRDIGSGWEDQTGEVSGMTFSAGQDRRFRVLCKVPYYTGINAGIIPQYRLLAECPTGQVTLHSAEGSDGVPSGQWKAEYDFEGTQIFNPITTWVEGTLPLALNGRGVTFGNGIFVAVFASGTGNRVMTSTDGITWTARVSAGDFSWTRVAYGNGIFVAVATGGEIMTSPDGTTWTRQTPPRESGLNDIAFGNGIFVAVSGNLSFVDQFYTSPDGINWTLRDVGVLGIYTTVAHDGSQFTALTRSATAAKVRTSTDGLTWTSNGVIQNALWTGVAGGNGVLVALGEDGEISTSTDNGLSWTAQAGLTGAYWEHILFANGQFVVCSSNKTADSTAVSTDGVSWTYLTTPISAFWNCLAADSSKFVCIGNVGVMTADIP